jgi:hypothetical protein
LSELTAATTQAQKDEVILRWKKTFLGGKEKKSLSREMPKAVEKTISLVKKIVKKPKTTLNMLSSICQGMSQDYKQWVRQTRLEQRSKSDMNLNSKGFPNRRTASFANIPGTSYSAAVRLEEARKMPDINTSQRPKTIEEMNEKELEDEIMSDEEMYDEEISETREQEFPSLESQGSEKQRKKAKKMKNLNGNAENNGTQPPPKFNFNVASIPPYVGEKRPRDQQ